MGDETFGQWLARRMQAAGYERLADLGRATGISPSLIGRWVRDEALPGMTNLRRLAPALGVTLEVAAAKAGHLAKGVGGDTPHALAIELGRLLADDSPVPDVEKQTLATLIEHVVSPYRRYLRRRKAS